MDCLKKNVCHPLLSHLRLPQLVLESATERVGRWCSCLDLYWARLVWAYRRYGLRMVGCTSCSSLDHLQLGLLPMYNTITYYKNIYIPFESPFPIFHQTYRQHNQAIWTRRIDKHNITIKIGYKQYFKNWFLFVDSYGSRFSVQLLSQTD